MNAEELWKESNIKGSYGTFSFGSDDPEQLIDLTIKGIKRATTGSLRLYEIDHEPIPKAGDCNVITKEDGTACCIVKNVRVIVCKYQDVTEEMAAIEGEGDKSLKYWKDAHLKFFTLDFQQYGLEFTDSEKVVFEQYELVYIPESNA